MLAVAKLSFQGIWVTATARQKAERSAPFLYFSPAWLTLTSIQSLLKLKTTSVHNTYFMTPTTGGDIGLRHPSIPTQNPTRHETLNTSTHFQQQSTAASTHLQYNSTRKNTNTNLKDVNIRSHRPLSRCVCRGPCLSTETGVTTADTDQLTMLMLLSGVVGVQRLHQIEENDVGWVNQCHSGGKYISTVSYFMLLLFYLQTNAALLTPHLLLYQLFRSLLLHINKSMKALASSITVGSLFTTSLNLLLYRVY